MRRLLILGIVGIVATGTVEAQSPKPPAIPSADAAKTQKPPSTSPNLWETGVVAIVNRDVITEAEVWRALRGKEKDFDAASRKSVFITKLYQLVEERVYEQGAEKLKLSINPDAVTSYIEDEKERVGSAETFEAGLREKGKSVGEYQLELTKQYQRSIVERVRSGDLKSLGDVLRAEHVTEPTASDVRGYYKANLDKKFKVGATARVWVMWLPKSKFKQHENHALETAQQVKRDLDTGADWLRVAEVVGGQDEKGGDQGWIDLTTSTLAAPIVAYAKTGVVGAVSEPIAVSNRAYAVVRVQERKEERVISFEEAQHDIRDRLRDALKARARNEIQLRDLRDAHIEPAELKRGLLRQKEQEILQR